MRKTGILLILILFSFRIFANVNYIDFTKISKDSNLINAFSFIKNNQQYYDHWSNEWNYDIPKEDLIIKLRENFKNFSALPRKNEDLYLLLGDIAHYLYNMDDTAYYEIAVINYTEAIKSNPQDYRSYWFLGYHYALSNVPVKAFENFTKAQNLLPTEQPADFWNDYAFLAAITNMPSHCIYAMDKVKSITGMEGGFEQQLGTTIYERIVPVDKNISYNNNDIWAVNKDDKIAFISRPLGIKIIIDSTWNLSTYDYQNNQSAFVIDPPTIKNKKGKEIGYTIAILFKTAGEKDKLDDYINNFISKYPDKTRIFFSDKYDKIIAFEIKDKTDYQDIGGAHLYMIGIERVAPKYPGLILENPVTLPKENNEEVSFYRASECKNRFEGKIFYAVLLDTCEDIFSQSFSVFKSLFNYQIIIE